MDSHVTLKMPNKDDGTVQRGFVQFPIFAALWSEQEFAYKNAESGKEEKKPMDFVLIAGGGGNTKSGVKNCIVSPSPSHPTEHAHTRGAQCWCCQALACPRAGCGTHARLRG